MDTLMLIS